MDEPSKTPLTDAFAEQRAADITTDGVQDYMRTLAFARELELSLSESVDLRRDAEELANALRDVLAGHPVLNADELIARYSPLPERGHEICKHDYRPAAFSESGEPVTGRRCAKCGDLENAVCLPYEPTDGMLEALGMFYGDGKLVEKGKRCLESDAREIWHNLRSLATHPWHSQGIVQRPARYCPECNASGDQVGEVAAECWTKGCGGVIASGMKP